MSLDRLPNVIAQWSPMPRVVNYEKLDACHGHWFYYALLAALAHRDRQDLHRFVTVSVRGQLIVTLGLREQFFAPFRSSTDDQCS